MSGHSLMAVGAHADDIELCIGGTLCKYRDYGYEVNYVMATNNMAGNWSRRAEDGTIKHTPCPPTVMLPQRRRESEAAAAYFGTEPIYLDHPQRHYFDEQTLELKELRFGCAPAPMVEHDVPTILTACEHKPSIERLADLIIEHDPEAVLTHGIVMVNLEHTATCLLVTQAYWQAVQRGYTGMLLHWHDITVGPFGDAYVKWDTFIDVSRYWQQKLKAIGLHACQVPTPEKLDLPPWGPACGCDHAEVFNIVSRGKRPKQGTAFNFEILRNMGG